MILCERSGRWAVALGRELGPTFRIYQTRSVTECWDRLAESPESLVVVELTLGNVERLLARMACMDREFPAARVAVVADRQLGEYEWLLCEAGAVMFVTSPRRLASLAELTRRHLALRPELGAEMDLTERIWAGLVWEGYAVH